jgi:hypothetical protein
MHDRHPWAPAWSSSRCGPSFTDNLAWDTCRVGWSGGRDTRGANPDRANPGSVGEEQMSELEAHDLVRPEARLRY